MGIQRKQNLEHLFNRMFMIGSYGAIRLHLSDDTTRQFVNMQGEHNKAALNRMVQECKEKGLCIIGIDIAGDAIIDRVNDWLRALGGIAGRLTVLANGYGGNYVVYIKPKH